MATLTKIYVAYHSYHSNSIHTGNYFKSYYPLNIYVFWGYFYYYDTIFFPFLCFIIFSPHSWGDGVGFGMARIFIPSQIKPLNHYVTLKKKIYRLYIVLSNKTVYPWEGVGAWRFSRQSQGYSRWSVGPAQETKKWKNSIFNYNNI